MFKHVLLPAIGEEAREAVPACLEQLLFSVHVKKAVVLAGEARLRQVPAVAELRTATLRAGPY